MEPMAEVTFVRGDQHEPLRVPADQIRLEPYGVVWRLVDHEPVYDTDLPVAPDQGRRYRSAMPELGGLSLNGNLGSRWTERMTPV